MPRVLVVGLRPEASGKTTVSAALLHLLRDAGVEAVPFKPWSASDTWVHHDDVAEEVARGQLVSRDARRLLEAAGSEVPAASVNPVHRVWAPAPLGTSRERASAPVLDRVHVGVDRAVMVVHPGASVPPELAGVVSQAAEVRHPGDGAALRTLARNVHLPAVRDAWHRVRDAPWVVVESYSDVAWPPGLDASVDAVLAAGPGELLRLEASRFRKGLRVVAGGATERGVAETSVARVLEVLDPADRASLPPLRREERRDPARAAGAYGEALEALVPDLPTPRA